MLVSDPHKQDSETLCETLVRVLDARQATSIATYDRRGHSALVDDVIVASANSARQVAALAQHVCAVLEAAKMPRIRVEGLPQADWVLVDGGDVVVHLFRDPVRNFYDLDTIFKASSQGREQT